MVEYPIPPLILDKKTKLIIAIAILGVAMMTSCSTGTDNKSQYVSVFYKVKTLENNTVFVARSAEPTAIQEYAFENGDTTWVNMDNQLIDQTDSLAMKVVILKRISTVIVDSTGEVKH